MTKKKKNLTTPEKIVHAFLIKDSFGAISKFAYQSNFSRAYISQHIHGHKHNKKLLQQIANHLECGVYGIFPNNNKTGQNQPERRDKRIKKEVPSPEHS